MPKLLLEIGCEELPASACLEASVQLPALAREHLGELPTDLYIGPRRLAFVLQDVPERTDDELRRGPAEGIAYDGEGRPTKAAEGFARGAGVAVEELERREGHVWARVPGEDVRETLPARLASIVRGLSFGKSMVWGPSFRFSRPVRWVCAKLGDETLDVDVDGIPAGGFSYGHRFTGGRVEVPSADAYCETLLEAGVEVDRARRWRAIVGGLDALGQWSDPAGVLDEVIYLVEQPLVLEGRFDDRYLALPPRVVETAMQSHQRYFPLGGARFAFVANGGDPDVVRAGNEQVLENRLEDATFTFERDLKKGIEGLGDELASITFAAGAGTFADKTARLVRLVDALGGGDASREAARLAKADQAAELVREFPELEGHIGAEYARTAGFADAVCAAIDEQYLPDASGGPLPATEAGKVLAAADKLDSLAVAFSLGQRPTGSRDPFGLRRAAIGLCRLAWEGGLRIDVAELLALDHRLLVEQGAEVEEVPDDLPDFVAERFEGMLEVPVEYVRAVRASGLTELRALAALATFLGTLDDAQLGLLHTAYSRAHRLAAKADGAAPAVDAALLTEPAEREVAETLTQVEPELDAALARLDVEAAVTAAARLGPPVDRFFDEVLVMAEDSAVRANRLRLLLDVRDTLGRLGDFSQIPR